MDFSPFLGQPVPYDGMPNAVSGIASFLLALEQNLGGLGYASPVSITAATTLTSLAYSKSHVATGTSADYTITLPTPTSGDVGRVIGFRMSPALTKVVTLDAGATRTIDSAQTRKMIAGESVTLLCVATSGMCWVTLSQYRPTLAARVYNSANISVANATTTALTFNSEHWDDGGLHSTSGNTDRLTAPIDGWYLIYGRVEFAANSTGIRAISFRVGATPDIYEVEQKIACTAPDLTLVGACCLVRLAAGDYVKMFAYQTSGGALNANFSAQYSPEFGMILLARV